MVDMICQNAYELLMMFEAKFMHLFNAKQQ